MSVLRSISSLLYMLCLRCASSLGPLGSIRTIRTMRTVGSAGITSIGMTSSRMIRRTFSRSSLKMMPEGPEVRSLVDSISSRFEGSNWHLTDATIVSGRYAKAVPENWDAMMTQLPAQVKHIKCKGKFIYFQCGDFYIFNTLGLSGGWSLSSSKNYTRASLFLTNLHSNNGNNGNNSNTGNNGSSGNNNPDTKNLHFYDMIGYGTLKICLSKDDFEKKLKSVGTCWLEEKPSFEEFMSKVKKTKVDRPLAAFLMDQSKLAGVGNYILSEVLYRSKIHPWAVCGGIDDAILLELYETIVTVIYSSYLSHQPGDSYYPGLTDHNNDHDGLMSKEILKKNMLETQINIDELNSLIESCSEDEKKMRKPIKKPVKTTKLQKAKTTGMTETIDSDNIDEQIGEIKLNPIWNSDRANSRKFKFQVYAQKTCPKGNAVIKEEGLHKRSIHWVPSIQVKCAPIVYLVDGVEVKIVKAKKPKKAKVVVELKNELGEI